MGRCPFKRIQQVPCCLGASREALGTTAQGFGWGRVAEEHKMPRFWNLQWWAEGTRKAPGGSAGMWEAALRRCGGSGWTRAMTSSGLRPVKLTHKINHHSGFKMKFRYLIMSSEKIISHVQPLFSAWNWYVKLIVFVWTSKFFLLILLLTSPVAGVSAEQFVQAGISNNNNFWKTP